MAEFLKPKRLKEEIYNLFNDAEDFLMIVSPFIKLPNELKKVLRDKQNDENFSIVVLYGKNAGNVSKSLSQDDLEFFKKFQNVEIRYKENLHAKFYANESQSIITSMNLHDYSIENNVEVGVQFKSKVLGFLGDNHLDNEAFEYFEKLCKKSTLYFERYVTEKRYFFGFFSKSEGSKVVKDKTEKYYKTEKPKQQLKNGYCIRSGEKIAFNIKMPYSTKSYESWKRYENIAYKEKYCHFSGEESNGNTSFEKPILAKNWKEANSK